MDVMLIKALDDYYQFDHPVEQLELREYLQLALYLNEQDALFALASLIAQNYLEVFQCTKPTSRGLRTYALLRPGPKLREARETFVA